MAWYKRFKNLLRSDRLSGEIEREIEFHLKELEEELVADGMSAEEARRRARLRFGNPTVQRERTRDADVLTWLESVGRDVRHAARALRRSPGFTLVAVLSLALGIGANTAIFSLVNAVLLRSLPVVRPEELVQLTMNGRSEEYTNPLWEEIRDRQDAFSGVFAFSPTRFDLASGGEARRVAGNWVSGDFFGTLGVRPSVGRLLGRSDDVRGCPAVAVLGHSFWRREYGGSAGVVGRTISLDGHPFEIVGVVDPAFSGVEVGQAVDVYAPLCAEAAVSGPQSMLDHRSAWFLSVMGRPRPGLSPAEVRARLAAISPAVFAASVADDWGPEPRREFLSTQLTTRPAATGLSPLRSRYRDALLVLMAGVGVVLLIACANVAGLLVARGAARGRELAIRVAIGAGRGRVVRQLLTESLLLSLVGAALGVLFARWASGLLVRLLSTRESSVWLDLAIDGRVLGFTLAVGVATGLLFGLAPAWRATRADPQLAMKSSGRGLSDGAGRVTLGRVLVVGQVALSLVLLAAAGLMLGTFRRLVTLDPGFHREGVLLVSVHLPNTRTPEERGVVQREALDEFRAIPGVRSASASAITPISGMGWNGSVRVDGRAPAGGREDMVWINAVSDGFFATLGTRLLAGRDVGPRDVPGAPRVAVVNESMARHFFGGASPLGRRFRLESGPEENGLVEVIGVVEDAKYMSLREEPSPTVYLPLRQQADAGPGLTYQLRTDGPPAALAGPVKAVMGRLERGASLRITTLGEQVSASLRRERLLAALSGFFGGLALLLALIGLYGTLAYSVARRRTEIGVRMALGAARPRVIRMVLGEAGSLVTVGVVVGLAASLGALRLVASFLFGLSPFDPGVLGLVAATLALVGLAAGALPAWRASRVDPMVALQNE